MKKPGRGKQQLTDREILEKSQDALDDLLAYLGITDPTHAAKARPVDRDTLRAALLELEEDIIERGISPP